MRKGNKILGDDINILKHLYTKIDKTEFKLKKAEVMKKHNISRATVYREMKKDIPGFYKTPRYWPPVKPITEKHKEMVRAMYQKQMTGVQICAEMERITGESWTWDRLQKIRKANDADDLLKKGETKKTRQRKKHPQPVESEEAIAIVTNAGESGSDAPKIETSVCKLDPDPIDWKYESPNGQDMKIFFEALLNADKMDRNSGLLLRFKGMEATFGWEELRMMQLYAASSAACKGRNAALFSKMVGIQLCYQQLRMFAAGAIHTPKDIDICLETISKHSDKPFIETPDFEFLLDVVRYFVPDIERERVITVCIRRFRNHSEASERMVPKEEANEILVRDMLANR